MTSSDRLFVAGEMVKVATVTSALAGAVGPLGTYTYGKLTEPDDEEGRYAMMGRAALGGSIGGLTGAAAGIPISMATGIPLLPGMLLSTGLGAVGSGIGSYIGAKHLGQKKKKKQKSK